MGLRSAMILAAGLISLSGGVEVLAAESPKTVTVVVGFSPGGGNDTYARLFAKYLPRYLQPNTNVIVENMPGSGSLKAVQSLSAEQPSGEVPIATFNYGLITESQIDPGHFHINLNDYKWIGSLASVQAVCYSWRGRGVANWADLMKRREFVVGAPAVGSSDYISAKMLQNALHAPVRVVTGYPGSADERIAIERGELDGGCGGWSSIPPDWISQHKIVPLVKFSESAAPGLPDATPLARNLAQSDKDRQLIDMLSSPSRLGRPFIVSKTTPDDEVRVLRAAFDKVAHDPNFVADAHKMNLPLDVINGADAARLVASIYKTPADIVSAAKKIAQ